MKELLSAMGFYLIEKLRFREGRIDAKIERMQALADRMEYLANRHNFMSQTEHQVKVDQQIRIMDHRLHKAIKEFRKDRVYIANPPSMKSSMNEAPDDFVIHEYERKQ